MDYAAIILALLASVFVMGVIIRNDFINGKAVPATPIADEPQEQADEAFDAAAEAANAAVEAAK